jgi:hypothetical protein
MRAEAELVLCAVQREVGTEQADDTLASLLQKNLDWKAVANLATRNGVLPLAYRRLNTVVADRGLSPLPEHLKTLFHVNAVRSRHLAAELLRLLKLLEGQGVTAIPFKGPTLAVLLHGDVIMRQFVDLDLFVRRSDVIRAAEVLMAAGYRTEFDCREALNTDFFDAYENEFVSPQSLATIDIHWAITPDALPFGPSLERLWTRGQQSSLDGTPVRALAPPDLVHVLCLQGCRDGWDKLASVCSVAGLVERIPEERDWKLLVEEAREYRTYRMVLLGLCLANRWLKAPLPPDVGDMISADRAITSLAQRIGAGFFTYGNTRRMLEQWAQQFVVPLKVIETRPGRWRYCVVRFARPTLRDGEFVRLPKPLFPLYYVLRPVRLLLAAVADLVKRLRR